MKKLTIQFIFVFCIQYTLCAYADESKVVSLTASVTVNNKLDRDISGYIHRISVPVEDGVQQRLLSVRYKHPEVLKYKRHKRGDTRYVEFKFDVPAQSSVTRSVIFEMALKEYNYKDLPKGTIPYPKGRYIRPQKYIESESPPVKLLSQKIQSSSKSDEERLLAAFQAPQDIIEYRVQSTKGAYYAVIHKTGDCTEYAALFTALARSMGYPARVTSEFLFASRNEFSQPNHHAAEVYFNGRWLPVDPNLAIDSKFGYGFGSGRVSKITLTRDFTWVWSNVWPERFQPHEERPKVTINWKVEIIRGS
ncbi:transglutaminase-like domain-containing protein [Microbulbifer variabilis]|uniref:transglutaminase-like domain-containing protein n=1 Tax=Microbulbifer variabilis TaxID=266805 RepID=UPI00039B604D|nr:transglutaminase domain-containing protein [Microbulbifer variabilis]